MFFFPSTLKEIGYCAFKNNNLSNLIIPKSVNKVEEWAFENNNFTNIKLENQDTEVECAFGYDISGITHNIPNYFCHQE